MTLSGSQVKCIKTPDNPDWEDATMAKEVYDLRPEKPVYLVEETPPVIVEWSTASNERLRSWDLSDYMPFGNKGAEGLAWVNDPSAPEGGYFYVGDQNDGRIYIFELKILTSTTSTKVTLVDDFKPDINNEKDIAGLFYYPYNKKLYIVLDNQELLIETDIDGKNPRQWDLVGGKEEGVLLLGDAEDSTVYVADDSGAVWVGDIEVTPP